MNGYFDYNATTPLSNGALFSLTEANLRHWHNPSSLYREAGVVKRKLEESREHLGGLLACEPERILFTSGATESNNSLFAVYKDRLPSDARVVASALEHPSVREPLARFFRNRVSVVRTTAKGEIDLDDFRKQIAEGNVGLVTVIAANNECGLLHPWKQISEICRERGVPFHTDATQWIGKLPTEDLKLCDYITGSAHKFRGPKGIGFLVMRDEHEALSFLRGGPQEEGRRAGTENYPSIEAMASALRDVTIDPVVDESDDEDGLADEDGLVAEGALDLSAVAGIQAEQRNLFEAEMHTMFSPLRIIGEGAPRLWNTSMFVLPHGDNRKWLARLSQNGFCVSTGSACSAGRDGSSVVLAALGADANEMRRVIRVSGGWDTAAEDWRALAVAFAGVGAELDEGAARK